MSAAPDERKPHDRGGWPTDERVDTHDHAHMDWEWRTDALARVLSAKGVISTDQMRRAIESLPLERYEASSYYERWSAAVEALLVEKGLLATAEVDARAGGAA
ncbi:MAG: nitrile hydratase subunit beta [Dehalococcoidia bacterium]|nr:nitrile hydratase subunit beta [Dehalococcoidia bacterium]